MEVTIVVCLAIIYYFLSIGQKKPFTFTGIIRKRYSLLCKKNKRLKVKETKQFNIDDLCSDFFDLVLELLIVATVWITFITSVPSKLLAFILGLIANIILLCLWGLLLFLFFDLSGKPFAIGEFIGLVLLAIMMLRLLLHYSYAYECITYVFFNASVLMITTNGIPITFKEREEAASRLATYEGKKKDKELLALDIKTMTALVGLVLQMIGTALALKVYNQSICEGIRIVCIITVMTYTTVRIAKIVAHHLASTIHKQL